MLDSDKFSTRQDLRSKKSMNQAQNNKKAQIENKRRMKPTKSYGLPKLIQSWTVKTCHGRQKDDNKTCK